MAFTQGKRRINRTFSDIRKQTVYPGFIWCSPFGKINGKRGFSCRASQLVIFSHSTIFITFSYRSLAGFLFKLLRSSRRRNRKWCWIFAFDRCVARSGPKYIAYWRINSLEHCLPLYRWTEDSQWTKEAPRIACWVGVGSKWRAI